MGATLEGVGCNCRHGGGGGEDVRLEEMLADGLRHVGVEGQQHVAHLC